MISVWESAIINAPAPEVWSLIRDFNGLPRWTPFVAASHIEDSLPADKIGCIRNFVLKDGAKIREQLLGLSDQDLSVTYAIVESPMGVTNYVSTLQLRPVTDSNQCFAEWGAHFDGPSGRDAELAETVGKGVFLTALRALKARFDV
ncbi:MAG: SRPBCC family protein [Azospirillaceae bacterium]|nr:SRPBCC family protein [Azospirillaceae bacterium]